MVKTRRYRKKSRKTLKNKRRSKFRYNKLKKIIRKREKTRKTKKNWWWTFYEN